MPTWGDLNRVGEIAMPSGHRLGERAIERGWISKPQLDEALQAQRSKPDVSLGSLLVGMGYLTPAQLSELLTDDPEISAALKNPENRFGRFVKVSKLGEGGMGTVWRCYDTELNRWVAAKFVEGRSDEVAARVMAEAQAAAKLEHPNIVRVYETGRFGSAHVIVMQLVDGHPVEGLRLPPNEAARILQTVATAVDAAHRQGILHRDLKPGNILLGRDGVPYVADFGLAKSMEGGAAVSSSRIAGTPSYMSPEQARGDPVDARSDVYALGASLYELISGVAPFDGSSPLEVLERVTQSDPAPLPASVPADLKTIILHAMEKDPQRRYSSARELAEDLQHFLQGEPIEARPASFTYRLRMSVARHRWVLAAALVAAMMVVLQLSRRPDFGGEVYRQAERDLHVMRARSYRADWRLTEEEFGEYRRLMERCQQEMEKSGSSADGWWIIGRARHILGNPDEALKAYDAGLALNSGHPWCLIYKARLLMERAVVEHFRHGTEPEELQKYARSAEEAVKLVERAGEFGGIDLDLARGYARVVKGEPTQEFCESMLKKWEGKDFREEFLLIRGLAHRERLIQDATDALKARPGFYDALFWRAVQRRHEGDLDGEIEDYTRAIEINPRNWVALEHRGRAREARKDCAGAVEDYTRAVAVYPTWVHLFTCRASARRSMGDLSGAAQDLDIAIQLDPIYEWYRCRANVRLDQRDAQTAFQDADRAVELGPNDPDCWITRAGARIQLQDYDGAVKDATRALQLNPRASFGYQHRAVAHMALKEMDAALADAAQGVEVDPASPNSHTIHALILWRTGDRAAALKSYNQALARDPQFADALWNRGALRLEMARRRSPGERELLEAALSDLLKALECGPKSWRTDPAYQSGVDVVRRRLAELDPK